MSLLGNLTVGILGNMSGLSGSLKESQTEVEKFGKNVDKLGQSITNIGQSMSLFVTGPLVALGTYAMSAGTKFDTQMSKVEAISGATGASLEKLRDQAKDLGATTVFMASQAAEGMEYLALAGWDAEAIYTAMPDMLNLAAAGALDLGRAADITSDTMAAFAMSADKAGHASDVFAYAQANANTSVEQMGEGMKYLSPVANALGWDLEQAAATLMTVADSGIKGSMGGRAFATSLARMAKPTAAMRKEMSRLNLSFFDAEGEIKSLSELVGELEVGLAGMTNEQKSASLSTIFGAEAYKHWAILLERGSDSLEELTTNLSNSDGAAQRMADTMLDNLGGSVIQLKSAIEGAALSLYELAEGPIRAVVDMATEWVGKFLALDDSTKSWILLIAGLTAALGPALVAMGSVVSAVGKLIPIFGALASPVGLIVAAIAGLAAGLIYLYNNNETVREALNAAWEWLKESAMAIFEAIKVAITVAFDAIKAFWDKWGADIMAFFSSVWELVKSVFSAAFEIIKSLVMTIFEFIKDFWDKWGADITAFFKGVWDVLKNVFETVIKVIWDFIKRVFEEIKTFWDKWGDTIVQAFKDYFEILKIVWSTVFNIIFGIIKKLFEQIKAFWDRWGQTITVVFTTILNVVKSVFEGVWNQIKIIIDVAIGVISGIIKGFLAVLKGDWQGAWDAVKGVAESIWDGIKKMFANVYTTMMNIGKDIIGGLVNGIKSMATAVVDTAKDVASSISNGVKGFFGIKSPSRLMAEYGRNIGEGLALGMESQTNLVAQAADDLAAAADLDLSNPAFAAAGSDFQAERGNVASGVVSEVMQQSRGTIVVRTPVYLDGNKITEVVSTIQSSDTEIDYRTEGVT